MRTPLFLLALLPGLATAQATDTIRVRVHDHEVVLYRTGAAGPVVVLEAGGGSSHRVWSRLVPELARHAQVITYDRPGYGLSAACASPRTALRIAQELGAALDSAGVRAPHYLAGWSFGGAIARTFAGEFPSRVRGLLLIDPAPEAFYARAARELPDQWAVEEEGYFPTLFRDSTRLAEQRELAAYSPSMEQAAASDAKHRTPTALLIAGRETATGDGPDAMSMLWIDELRRWAARRPATTVTMVPRAGHHIARDDPDAVVRAFVALASRTRTAR